MTISNRHKYIFISNPKTGTSSVQKWLLRSDDSALLNYFPEDSSIVSGKDEHIRTKDLMVRLGGRFESYRVFTFVRDPYDKAVSAYFFYRNGRPIFSRSDKRYFFAYCNVFLAKVLPFSLWSLLKPLKGNREYLVDRNGVCLVNYIGDTKKLEEHLFEILTLLGVKYADSFVEKINTSGRLPCMTYFETTIHKCLFDIKYRRELMLYKKISEYPVSHDFRGQVFEYDA